MTFFSSRPRRKGNTRYVILGLSLITFSSLALLPTGYVIEKPGQVFDVMGQVSGEPVISSPDLPTYPSDSRFDVTTVSLLGNPTSTPSWLQVLVAWVDSEQKVIPLDEVYPDNRTAEEIRAESTAQMEISQQDAIAAALIQLGYEVPRSLYVASVLEDTPSSKILIAGDIVISAAGKQITEFEELREQIQLTQGNEIEIVVLREGQEKSFLIVPELREDLWVIGAMISYTYTFPVDIELQLGEVGGPSGGLMFTLGILDSLTEGSLAGEKHISGTGTISANGEVGPIGGIDLKMISARKSGADLFLVPSGNCQEAIGQVPEGLSVISVRDLAEALAAIEQVKSGSVPPPLSCN
jgi:PDZ domain-containing protein